MEGSVLLAMLYLSLVTRSSAKDLLLWSEEIKTGNPSKQPNARLQSLPADPTTYAPALISSGYTDNITTEYLVSPGKFVALDIDHQDKVILFSASIRAAIYKGAIETERKNATKIIGGISKEVEGIAVDWLTNNVYVIDPTDNWIFITNHRENWRYAIVICDGLDKPRGIAVHPIKGFLFWSDCGKVPKIERANLDGTNRRNLITTDITSPNGLSVDYSDNRIYWTDVDEQFSKVESCDFDGSNRRVLFIQSRSTSQFYKLKVHKEYVWITDWELKLRCVHKASGKTYFDIFLQSQPHGVTIYGDGSQVIEPSPCFNHSCSNICTSSANGYHRCLCKDSFYLLPDGKTCQRGNEDPEYVITVTRGTTERTSVSSKGIDVDKWIILSVVIIICLIFAIFIMKVTMTSRRPENTIAANEIQMCDMSCRPLPDPNDDVYEDPDYDTIKNHDKRNSKNYLSNIQQNSNQTTDVDPYYNITTLDDGTHRRHHGTVDGSNHTAATTSAATENSTSVDGYGTEVNNKNPSFKETPYYLPAVDEHASNSYDVANTSAVVDDYVTRTSISITEDNSSLESESGYSRSESNSFENFAFVDDYGIEMNNEKTHHVNEVVDNVGNSNAVSNSTAEVD